MLYSCKVQVSPDGNRWATIGEIGPNAIEANRMPIDIEHKLKELQPPYYRVKRGPSVLNQVSLEHGVEIEEDDKIAVL